MANICNLDESLAAKVNNLVAPEAIQDGQSKEFAAAQHEFEEIEEELLIEKCHSTKLQRQLKECKSEPEATVSTDITQLWWEKDILLH